MSGWKIRLSAFPVHGDNHRFPRVLRFSNFFKFLPRSVGFTRVSLLLFISPFFYFSLFFPFFFNIVMDVEEREKREREKISRNVWDDNGGLEFIKGRAQLGVE